MAKLAPTGILGALWTAAPAICGTLLLLNLGLLSDWLLMHRAIGLGLYVMVFVLAAGLGFLPTYMQSILGGWVFGLWVGLPAALIGFTGGAFIGYQIARRVSKRDVQDLIERNPKARAVHEALIGGGYWRTVLVVALLRLPPTSPFALTNLVMASVGVPLGAFLLGTSLGLVPRTLLAVGLAAAAARTGARDIQTFAADQGAWLLVAGLSVMAAALLGLVLIARRGLRGLGSSRSRSEDPARPA